MHRRSYGVGLILMSVLLAAAYSADIHPLQDGMLITGRNLLKIQKDSCLLPLILDIPCLEATEQGLDSVKQLIALMISILE